MKRLEMMICQVGNIKKKKEVKNLINVMLIQL